MDKYEISQLIEDFAPLELQENWDCSGWCVDAVGKNNVNKVMLCLTVTKNVIAQAKELNCDMIISHHPLFYVPLDWCDINIYCAHTNLDRAKGGTTDTLVRTLGLEVGSESDFLRFVDCEMTVDEVIEKLKKINPYVRYINNMGVEKLNKIAFCAGSGADFISEAQAVGADAFVTGDIKFHTALDSEIVIFDVGHFESEIMVLATFEKLLRDIQTVKAEERSPFLVK